MQINQVSYQIGIPEAYRETAVELYDEAFGKKISVAIRNKEKRLKLLHQSLILKHATGAFYENKLIGIAGFRTFEGALTSGIEYRDLLAKLGFIHGNWAAVIFSLYERKPNPGELVMDGIAVHATMQGKGVGFQSIRVESFPYLKNILGFGGVTTMVFEIT